jgi:F-type H+-transporting ATPase subunit a
MNAVFAELLPSLNELFDWKGIFGPHTILEFNKTALMAFVSTLICIAFFGFGARRRALVPVGIQNAAEAGYEAIEQNIGIEVMGAEEGRKWTPFLATLFFWIFFINIWSIVPGIQFPATSRIAIPLFLAIIVWILYIFLGFVHWGPGYIWQRINPPGVPKALKPLLIVIEFFSTFVFRPFTLAVRLFANMTAGHVLLTIFAVMCNELLIVHNSGWYQVAFAPLPIVGLIAMTGFELFIGLLQAYIFSILTAVYLSESIHPEH